MNELIEYVMNETGATSPLLAWAMLVVGGLIIIFSLVGIGISLFLFVKYNHLNHKKNSCGMTGLEAARKILDDNDLNNIKIKCTGSMIWGNSYSHYFKKLRLRRFTYKKNSVTSLAMAAEKSSLAVLDKEGDTDMKRRNVLIPLQFFGPLMFIPLVVIGVLIDIAVANTGFIATAVCAGLGIALYAASFALTVVILKVETKAQRRSLEILKEEGLATEEELADIKELYKYYNLEYINNMIIAFLELLLRILQIVAASQGVKTGSKD